MALISSIYLNHSENLCAKYSAHIISGGRVMCYRKDLGIFWLYEFDGGLVVKQGNNSCVAAKLNTYWEFEKVSAQSIKEDMKEVADCAFCLVEGKVKQVDDMWVEVASCP